MAKEKAFASSPAFQCPQLLIFPARRQASIFSVDELNFCVRHGNRWNLIAIVTD